MIGAAWTGWKVDALVAFVILVPMVGVLLAFRHYDREATKLRWLEETERTNRDDLTGLPNRRWFLEKLRLALEQPLKPSESTAVFFIDLDRFKGINDALGHLGGDRFLREVSGRLTKCLGDRGVLSRFGGDEFTILLNPVQHRHEVLDLANEIMAQFEQDIQINGNAIWANTSMGIAMVGMPRPGADDLLAMADAALYNAKAQGRGQYVMFEPNLPRPTPRAISLDAEIRTALDAEQLLLHFQPVVRLSDLQIVGLEALVRWDHPRYGLLSPREFIPLAEENGVIKALGSWVTVAACEKISAWQGLYGESLTMSVNLSALQFRQKELLDEIASASKRSHLNPNSVTLEITESILLRDDEHTRGTLNALREMGFRLAIDDFGVGYSSLSYLRSFYADILKLDQSFLNGLEADPRAQALVRGAILLGHSLGMKVVAEGIETGAQLSFLSHVGCDEGQGYLLCKPLEEAQLINHFTQYGLNLMPQGDRALLRATERSA